MQGRLSDPSSTTLLRSFSSKVHLYLGTGSATRREILAREGFTFEVHKANIDEKAFGDRAADPDDLVRLLAIEKSRAILRQWQLSSSPSPTPAPSITHHRIPLLLTADQVVVCRGKILEKPRDLQEAKAFVSLYNNHSCSTVGSILLHLLPSPLLSTSQSLREVIGVEKATIHFDQIPEEVVDRLLSDGQALHCAGGLMVEHPLLQPYIKRIDGTMDSVMGLSCELLEKLLIELDLPLPQS
eukprot:gene581-626_t